MIMADDPNDPFDSEPDDPEWVIPEAGAALEPIPTLEPPSDSGLSSDDGSSSYSTGSRPSPGRAALVIILVSAPLLILLYLGHLSLGLSFPPFNLVDWLNRTDSPLWARIMEAMVEGTTAVTADDLLRRTAQSEWLAGTALFFLLALIVGLLFYAMMRRRGRSNVIVTLIFGSLFAAPFLLARTATADSPLPIVVDAAWLAGWGIMWALVIDHALGRLAGASRPPQAALVPAPMGIDRRQFLLRFGAGAAAIAAIGSAATAAVAQEQTSRAPRTLPMISPELMDAQQELFGRFRRFAIVRSSKVTSDEANVLALGAEYPDRQYVSVWIGDHSPIMVYGDLRSALEAFGTDGNSADVFFLDE